MVQKLRQFEKRSILSGHPIDVDAAFLLLCAVDRRPIDPAPGRVPGEDHRQCREKEKEKEEQWRI